MSHPSSFHFLILLQGKVGAHCTLHTFPTIFCFLLFRSECTAEQAQAATGGRAIFASGSPFPDVKIDGKLVASSQCNNR